MKRAETTNEQEFRRFFREAQIDIQYVLVYVVSGKGCSRLGPLVRRFDSASHTLLSNETEAMIDRILHAAQQDCRGIGFTQKYGVFLFDERRSSEHLARFILSMRPKA